MPARGIRAALFGAGPCAIAVLEPTRPDTGLARFLAQRGEGLHHLGVESDDVAREVRRLVATGVEIIDPTPRHGLAAQSAFIHPRAAAGILIEVTTSLERTAPAETALTLTAIHLAVADVPRTSTLYRDLFGATLRLAHPGGSVAQLAVGDVTLRLASTAGTSRTPALSLLRFMTHDLDELTAQLRARGLPVRPQAAGLVLNPSVTRGVPLLIQPRTRKVNVFRT